MTLRENMWLSGRQKTWVLVATTTGSLSALGQVASPLGLSSLACHMGVLRSHQAWQVVVGSRAVLQSCQS